MVDDFRWMGLIQSNLIELTKSTVIDTDLVVGLFAKNLISDEERHLLLDERTPNVRKATTLYTTTTTKWLDSDFEKYKILLLDTGNLRAFQILTNTPQEALLVKVSEETQKEIDIFRQLEDTKGGGAYEGVSLEEEQTANAIAAYSRGSRVVMDGVVQLDGSLDKQEVIQQLMKFEVALKEGHIWWNPQKTNLPSNYIERSVIRSSQFYSNGSFSSTAKRTTLVELSEDLVLLVDPPGMGKSTEMTDLDLKLRMKVPHNRIILRVNLNEVQKALSTISNVKFAGVLFHLAPFVPLKTLQMEGIHIFVLLDGLDEVCPKHQATMIKLVGIFRPSLPNSVDPSVRMKMFVTMRPHLRNPMESAFNVESFSLAPLELEEQDKYIKKELKVTGKELTELRNKFENPLADLLSNPLMLFMLVDILKSPESLSITSVINIYDLNSRFVSSKHKLHLVTKKRMAAGDNFTELEVESMLERNLRFYFHVALDEILWEYHLQSQKKQFPSAFFEWKGNVLEPPSNGSIHTELLSYGLLTLNTAGRLVFKHQSFAEFFYSNLLCHPDTRQEVRDTLFGYVYGPVGVLENVETFVAAALTSTNLQSNFHLTSKWLLFSPIEGFRTLNFSRFARGQLFHILIRQVLLTFVKGDPKDLLSAFCVLVERSSREAFAKVLEWMGKNGEWCREDLFMESGDESCRYSPPAARLIVAIAILFKAEHLTQDEVAEGFKSCKNLLSTIACIDIENRNKWIVLEDQFGETKFKDLVKEVDSEDFYILIKSDAETVWKLFTTFTREELFSLVSKEETRVSDVVGDSPLIVLAAFGEDFIPRKSHLAEFRGKFGRNEGKSVFEMDGCDFALEYLWEDLLREAEESNSEGPVTVALRKALARNGGSSTSSKLLRKLEKQVRRRRSCPCDSDEVSRVMEWLVDGFFLSKGLNYFEYKMLPFLIRYSTSAEHAAKLFQQNKSINLEDEPTLLTLLQFLVLSAHQDNSTTFSLTKTFLQKNLRSIPPKWASVTQNLSSAEKAELRKCLPLHPSLLVSDISVGQVFIALLPESLTEEEFPWEEIVSDVIRSTRCCNIHATLTKLRTLLREDKLRGVLLSRQVRHEWWGRFSSRQRKEADYPCGLRSLLSFYFDVFGLNLGWINEDGPPGRPGAANLAYLVSPVEMVTILEAKCDEKTHQNWNRLVPQFEEMANKLLGSNSGIHLTIFYSYKTEWEWERLLRMIPLKENALQQTSLMSEMSDSSAVPFVRVLMRKLTMDKSNKECLRTLLQKNHPNVSSDSVQSSASLLHIFIELEYLEQVERYTLPGFILWRDSEEKNAIDVAQEKLGNEHQITRHLQKHYDLLAQT